MKIPEDLKEYIDKSFLRANHLHRKYEDYLKSIDPETGRGSLTLYQEFEDLLRKTFPDTTIQHYVQKWKILNWLKEGIGYELHNPETTGTWESYERGFDELKYYGFSEVNYEDSYFVDKDSYKSKGMSEGLMNKEIVMTITNNVIMNGEETHIYSYKDLPLVELSKTTGVSDWVIGGTISLTEKIREQFKEFQPELSMHSLYETRLFINIGNKFINVEFVRNMSTGKVEARDVQTKKVLPIQIGTTYGPNYVIQNPSSYESQLLNTVFNLTYRFTGTDVSKMLGYTDNKPARGLIRLGLQSERKYRDPGIDYDIIGNLLLDMIVYDDEADIPENRETKVIIEQDFLDSVEELYINGEIATNEQIVTKDFIIVNAKGVTKDKLHCLSEFSLVYPEDGLTIKENNPVFSTYEFDFEKIFLPRKLGSDINDVVIASGKFDKRVQCMFYESAVWGAMENNIITVNGNVVKASYPYYYNYGEPVKIVIRKQPDSYRWKYTLFISKRFKEPGEDYYLETREITLADLDENNEYVIDDQEGLYDYSFQFTS
ncbi:gp10 [Sphingomonas phage PAU]|uniref:gp10 n=1 Tax=Sphingomonas phage PAU TaxID=1150991 RepID=UPI000257310F|nr:gp10 [Sphingomonas phage PAU]AFF28008.1 gp10 [Sphingomonas phage PAU]